MCVVSLSSIGAGNERQRQSSVEEVLLEGADKTTFDSPGRGLVQTLKVLFQPGAVVELRAFRGRETVSGYYDDHAALAREARKLDESDYAVYVTLNEVDPALLARASNRRRKVYREPTTSDGDIVRRRWLPLDFDPARPSGVSATDAEKKSAKERALQVRHFLVERGWPEPVMADSGNGYHLLYPVDLPNDRESLELVKGILQSLAFRFDDDRVKVDTTTSNAARIWKLYGTTARKGDDTQERPHRLSRLLVPEGGLVCMVVDREKLVALATTRLPSPGDERRGFDLGRNGHKEFDLEEWIDHHNVPVRRAGSWGQGGYRWVLEECPWNAHTDNSAYIVQFLNGAIAAGCHHDSCEGYGWPDLREHYEPGAYERNGRGEDERHGVTAPIGGRDRDDASYGSPLTLKTFAEIPDPGAREFDVEKILPKGYALLFYGDGGTAKSLLIMSVLQAISRGAEEWLGLEVGRKAACLFVDFELDESEQRRRAFEVAAGEGLSAPPSNLYYLSAVGHPPKEVLSYARCVCEEKGIGVVAIDSVGLALEGDPGSARDVVGFFRELDTFRASGITLILVDHQAKLQAGESYQGKLQYGSSYKGNLSRSRVQVEPKKRGANVRSLVLRQNKANFSDLAEPFGVKVVFEPGKILVSREELDPADLAEERVLNTSDRVLLALADGPAFPNDFYSQSVWGVEFATVKNNITKLRKDGLVQDTGEIEGQQREIELTEAGRKYVEDYLSRHAAEKRHGVTPPIGDRDRDDAFDDNASGSAGREESHEK